MSDEPALPAASDFDEWYAAMSPSLARDAIVQRHLGLPAELFSSSLLTWDGLGEVADVLRLRPGDRLIDVACGRGGYGLEIAARTGAALIGVDFSPEAVTQAAANATRSGRRAEFRVGDLADTGLGGAIADAVVVVDAIQFASEPRAAYAELLRILRPGGRIALTCWEALDRADERVSTRIRQVALAAGLEGAGFMDVAVVERPDWYAAELALWQEAAALEPAGDEALQDLHDEGVSVLRRDGLTRRVLATATAPCPPISSR